MIMKKLKEESGFTLIEMLIVIIILGILATVIIPQITVSTGDAKLNALKTNLSSLRNAIELYYHQHDARYPGITKADGVLANNDAEATAAFVPQVTLFSEVDGTTSNTKTPAAKYGPYIKRTTLPENPYNNKNDVFCEWDETDITVRSSAGDNYGWKFYPKTGVLIPADNGAHDTL